MTRIVLDHLTGSRRGQRQELSADQRVRFGRHPDNEVSFDAHRDLDASSRHAELRREDGRYVLRDIGSSNGLWVRGARLTEFEVPTGEPVEVEFGSGGPKLRVYIGDPAHAPAQPAATESVIARESRLRRALLVAVVVVGLAAAGIALGLGRCSVAAAAGAPRAAAGANDLRHNARVLPPRDSAPDERSAHAVSGV
jgi:hypothetical protein